MHSHLHCFITVLSTFQRRKKGGRKVLRRTVAEDNVPAITIKSEPLEELPSVEKKPQKSSKVSQVKSQQV